MKNKEKLLIDSKKCTKCGHALSEGSKFCSECGESTSKKCSNCDNILEKDSKVCDECGYNSTMEESFKFYMKEFKKILNEQTSPSEFEFNPDQDPRNAQQITKKKTPIGSLPQGSVVRVNRGKNESENYTYSTKDKTLNKSSVVDMDSLKDGDKINVVADEGRKKISKKKKPNPWAICTATVGREDKEKYERCVMDIKGYKSKKKKSIDEELQKLEEYIERIITDSEVNPKIKKGKFKEFVSKLK